MEKDGIQNKSENNMNVPVVTKKKTAVGLIICIIGVVAILLIVIVLVLDAAPDKKVNGLLDEAKRYLTDLSYEQAIASYEDAIKLDPKNEDAYLGLANVYIAMAEESLENDNNEDAMNYYDKAKEVLENGLNKTDDSSKLDKQLEAVISYIEELENVKLESGNINSSGEDSLVDDSFVDKDTVALADNNDTVFDDSDEVAGDINEEALEDEAVVNHTEDGKWYVTKSTSYSSDGKISGWEEYQYDKMGNVTKISTYSNSVLSRQREYEYYADGREKKCCDTRYGENAYSYEDEYDYNNNDIYITTKISDGTIYTGEERVDSHGNTTKSVVYFANGDIANAYEFEYEYDKYGSIVKCTSYANYGEVRSVEGIDRYEYEYDNNSNVSKKFACYEDGSRTGGWTEYEYEFVP